MFDNIIKWYYMIPKVKFRNPFRFEKRDSREPQWFKMRRKYGFDERELWCLGHLLNDKIKKFLNIPIEKEYHETTFVTLQQFTEWFKNCPVEDITWLYNRVHVYIEFDCPTFYRLDNEYVSAPGAEQIRIKNKLYNLLGSKKEIMILTDKEIEFVFNHVFDLGW